jgi:hypothetical protein
MVVLSSPTPLARPLSRRSRRLPTINVLLRFTLTLFTVVLTLTDAILPCLVTILLPECSQLILTLLRFLRPRPLPVTMTSEMTSTVTQTPTWWLYLHSKILFPHSHHSRPC